MLQLVRCQSAINTGLDLSRTKCQEIRRFGLLFVSALITERSLIWPICPRFSAVVRYADKAVPNESFKGREQAERIAILEFCEKFKCFKAIQNLFSLCNLLHAVSSRGVVGATCNRGIEPAQAIK